jgi:hypothetical protein
VRGIRTNSSNPSHAQQSRRNARPRDGVSMRVRARKRLRAAGTWRSAPYPRRPTSYCIDSTGGQQPRVGRDPAVSEVASPWHRQLGTEDHSACRSSRAYSRSPTGLRSSLSGYACPAASAAMRRSRRPVGNGRPGLGGGRPGILFSVRAWKEMVASSAPTDRYAAAA